MTRKLDRRALVLGPPGDARQELVDLCRAEGWRVEVASAEEMTSRLAREDTRLVLLRIGDEGSEPWELLADMRAEYPTVVPVVYTTVHEIHPVVEAITRGAFDALKAPFEAEEVRAILDRADRLEKYSETPGGRISSQNRGTAATVCGLSTNRLV